MPSDAYTDGVARGTVAAHTDAVQVKAAKNGAGLGKLAGLRLDIYKRQNQDARSQEGWWIKSQNKEFELGFFEGFMTRAEIIREAEK